jgi:hyperosmotically inducible periplasmic protein
MNKTHCVGTQVLALGLLLFSGGLPSPAQTPDNKDKSDNTKANKRDRSPDEATADQQKMNAEDTALVGKIRKSIIADKSLSTYAHNIKIISQNGIVTLKGPVRSDAEVKTIVSKATEAAGGGDKVVNQITVERQ